VFMKQTVEFFSAHLFLKLGKGIVGAIFRFVKSVVNRHGHFMTASVAAGPAIVQI